MEKFPVKLTSINDYKMRTIVVKLFFFFFVKGSPDKITINSIRNL
jgi:hypothetical protein